MGEAADAMDKMSFDTQDMDGMADGGLQCTK
jgi:hypothetical protein